MQAVMRYGVVRGTVLAGWRPGKEEGTVGSLNLGLYDADGKLRVVGHTSGFTAKLPDSFGALTAGDVRAACNRHLRPDDAVTVAVTTAEQAEKPLGEAGAGALTVVDHDEY